MSSGCRQGLAGGLVHGMDMPLPRQVRGPPWSSLLNQLPQRPSACAISGPGAAASTNAVKETGTLGADECADEPASHEQWNRIRR